MLPIVTKHLQLNYVVDSSWEVCEIIFLLLERAWVPILILVFEVTADDSLSVSLNQPERSNTDEGRRDDAQALSAGVDRFRARQRPILSGGERDELQAAAAQVAKRVNSLTCHRHMVGALSCAL